MNNLKEMPSSMYREIGGQLYFVRLFGIDGVAYEEQLVPVPGEYLRDTTRQLFNRQRDQFFTDTEWVRQRHTDRIGLGIEDPNWGAWLDYWQALRDLPEMEGFDPASPVWPQKPE